MQNPILRGVYRTEWPRSRNLPCAVYAGDGAYIGIREKFGERYLFAEYDYDPPYNGTVRVTAGDFLGVMVPPGIRLSEYASDESVCLRCGQRAWWTGSYAADGFTTIPGPWECGGGCADPRPTRLSNRELFDFLDSLLVDGRLPS